MEESITCRGPCKKVWAKFGRSSFLRHVKQAKKCKEKYSDNEIIELEKAGKERTKRLQYQGSAKERQLKRKRDCYDSEQRNKKYQRGDKEKELKRQRDCYDSEKRNKKYK